jgi:hypothetical protein
MTEDLCSPFSVLTILSYPYPSTAVFHFPNTAALKSLSTHGFPFRHLRRCSWFVLHRSTVSGRVVGLTRVWEWSYQFNLLKPRFEGFSTKEDPAANAHGWQPRNPVDLAIDDIGEMRAGAPDEGCGLGEVQYLRGSSTIGLDGTPHTLHLGKRSICDSVMDIRACTPSESL